MAGTKEGAAKRLAARAALAVEDQVVEETVAEEPEFEEPEPIAAKYVAAKRFTYNDHVYRPGDPVPGAEGWFRVEAWVRARWLREAA